VQLRERGRNLGLPRRSKYSIQYIVGRKTNETRRRWPCSARQDDPFPQRGETYTVILLVTGIATEDGGRAGHPEEDGRRERPLSFTKFTRTLQSRGRPRPPAGLLFSSRRWKIRGNLGAL